MDFNFDLRGMSSLKSCVLLFSGGMDSSVLLYYLVRVRKMKVHCLVFDYGQRHRIEIDAARRICESLSLPSTIFKLDYQDQLGASSPLVDMSVVVPAKEEDKQSRTVVPGRNSIFLSVGASLAEIIGYESVFFCPTLEDYRSYPDCRVDFIDAISIALVFGSGGKIKGVYAPFVKMSKAEIVKLGVSLRVPFQLTHTCYNGSVPPCGVCDACVERIEAFKSNRLNDPLIRS